MTLEELQEKLESITGNTPIDNARRVAILTMIGQLMEQGENDG